MQNAKCMHPDTTLNGMMCACFCTMQDLNKHAMCETNRKLDSGQIGEWHIVCARTNVLIKRKQDCVNLSIILCTKRYDMCMLLCNARFEQTCDVWHEQQIGFGTDWGRTCSVCTDKCPLEKKERLCQFVNYIVYNKPVITHDTWAFPIPSIVPETCSFCWCAWCVFVHSSTVCAEIDAVSPNKQACP